MRYVALLLIGILMGALACVAAIGAMRQGTPYDGAVMAVMSQQMAALRGMSERNACDAAEIDRRLALLGAIAGETEAAFLPIGDDARFTQLSQDLRDAVTAARSHQAADCDALAKAMAGVGGSCKACHDVFR